ncbi:hypothetical protein GE300_22210 [Rhodobacteraceae bacterium 2CG4]|uniref:Uncharacterized protein n=1 Tax=Halovulum marinum TaxID=2662447 RepID=A0A6L5Z721_9RHOB|nr:hypothetical protein [Halovulum marinum]MSU92247.1 hypothetical protein [Halovulum marinum]
MSYDLNFWRYADEGAARTLDDHLATYHALSKGEVPAGLGPIDRGAVLAALRAALEPAWTWEGGAWTRPGAVIEFGGTAASVRIDLRGKWPHSDANRIIDIMADDFGCPLFDPQIRPRGERFGPRGGA